ncbi:hypothetical protein SJ05684_c01310 [Sinorhizobium sojae CCBAU 05684]|uniref:Uncharacterized protein n=1 Tax=Sinorhizobium sojae CCBAU 05684 TaxID=716928 RepID=A0A249P7A0_9HYPH|nr:hypothetical protein SJ05684_c01310 [Sinorhizobium sojae CCBAU 05684]
MDELGCRAPVLAHRTITFKNKKPAAKRPVRNPAFLAICLTWLQADRPNHHGIKLQYCLAVLASIPGVWFCLAG